MESLRVRRYRYKYTKRYRESPHGQEMRRLANKRYRQKHREYHLERKKQYYIRKRLDHFEPMKTSILTRTEHRSEKEVFEIIVERKNPEVRGEVELMTPSYEEIILGRVRGGGSVRIGREELSELMLLISDFAEHLEKHKKSRPHMVTEEVKSGAGGGGTPGTGGGGGNQT